MDHVCSSGKDDHSHEILNSSHQEEPPLFSGFPSPFFDDIDTIPILANDYTHHQNNSLINITEPNNKLPSDQSKRVKKRSVGKKDRHSKIHTAQGLRDRRMRLSLHIARKFFDLQDLLGFDKASKTIEWLFCKSNKAIKEVADNFDQKDTNQLSLTSEEFDSMDWGLTECDWRLTNKLDNFQEMDQIKNKESRKRIQSNTNSSREQARARARERTRERMMIKELEKSKFLFEGINPNDHGVHKLGLGYIVSPDHNRNVDTSSVSEPVQLASSPSDFSSTHHLLRELQLANSNHVDVFKNYSSGSINNVGAPLMNHNPDPAGWLNSSYGFIGIPGGFDADDHFMNDSIVPTIAHLTGDDHIYEQSPSSFVMSTTTNFLHFQTQNQREVSKFP